jgi:hypothetical protein
MKVKLLIVLSLFCCQFSFSQSKDVIQGKVLNQNLPLKGVDVINFNTKVQTTTDQLGHFSIVAKTNDLLVFISKEFDVKKITVNQKFFDEKAFIVNLNLKPEELKEVVVTNKESIQLSKDIEYERGKSSQVKLDDAANTSKTGVYDGTIENGADFLQIGSMILGLFIKEKEAPKPEAPKVEFSVIAKNSCKEEFFLETLKLKPEEIDLFLQYCNEDPKSKVLISENNVLSMMDFLSAKNIEFQKFKI